MSIPRKIHYCWMSGEPFPTEIKECLDSWKKIMPDFEIKLWDGNNFDVNRNRYTKEAMECKKYAFVSDYIRLFALYTEGGIYLDSDVKAIRPFDDLLNEPAFVGYESGGRIGPWLIAAEAGNPLIKELLDYYVDKPFIKENGEMDQTPNTVPVTNILTSHGLLPDNKVQKLDNITVFPEEFFCPKNPWNGREKITENTFAMHLFLGAWKDTADDDMSFISAISRFVNEFIYSIGPENDKVIVYGMGIVGRNVLEELKSYTQISVERIFVTKRENNWNNIDGIPIIECDNSVGVEKRLPVLVATTKKYHKEIEEKLKENGYTNIFFLGGQSV